MLVSDQLHRQVNITVVPKRIVSLVPSITELLCDLGLENELVGITKFCVRPTHVFRSKTRVGGTKKVDHDKIVALNPDLIIANKEENTKSDIDSLEKMFPVWVSDVKNLEDTLQMILNIGQITGKEIESKTITNTICNTFRYINPLNNIKTLYLVWKKPYMASGCDTFINEMMGLCGMQNVLTSATRYPELTIDEIRNLNPELILLSSEPYPFKDKDVKELQELFPEQLIMKVDGEFFSWYGSRLLQAGDYFNFLNVKISGDSNKRHTGHPAML